MSSPCTECAPRGWLLAELSGWLDCACPDRERLRALLALTDEELARAARGARGVAAWRRGPTWWYGGPRFYRNRWNGGGFGPCWTQTPIGNVWNCGR